MDGHRPNPPSIPSHQAVIQHSSSDTSSPNRRPSYRSQTSDVSEDDNLLRPDDIPYDDDGEKDVSLATWVELVKVHESCWFNSVIVQLHPNMLKANETWHL